MEPEPYPAEPLSAHWKAIGDTLKNENTQWVHQMNVVDAQNNRMGFVGYTPTECFQHCYARKLVARTYPNRSRTRSLPLPYNYHVQRYVPIARDVQKDQPRFEWLRRIKSSRVQKLHLPKDITVVKLLEAKDTTVVKLLEAKDNTVAKILQAKDTTVTNLLQAKNTTADNLLQARDTIFYKLRQAEVTISDELLQAENTIGEKLRQAKDTIGEKLRQAKDTIVDKIRLIDHRMLPWALYPNLFLGIGLMLFAMLVNNGKAAHYKALQETPASLYVNSFPTYPTWLHTNALQVIGLPAQVDPAFMPYRRTIEKACKKFRNTWHPDSQLHLLSDQDALAVVHRGDLACQWLEQYQHNQNCKAVFSYITNFDITAKYREDPFLLPVLSASAPAGAPHFAKNCRCTYAKYYRAWLYRVLMPVDLQPDPPSTLEEMCPCTRDMAMKSWESFSFSDKLLQPPYLKRIKNDLSMFTTDWRVLWWNIKGLLFPDDRILKLREGARACSEGIHKGCERMEGWTSPSDFDPGLQACSKGMTPKEAEEIKMKLEKGDLVLEELKQARKRAREEELKERSQAIEEMHQEAIKRLVEEERQVTTERAIKERQRVAAESAASWALFPSIWFCVKSFFSLSGSFLAWSDSILTWFFSFVFSFFKYLYLISP